MNRYCFKDGKFCCSDVRNKAFVINIKTVKVIVLKMTNFAIQMLEIMFI